MLLLSLTAAIASEETLVRVDVPDHPQALISSDIGSLLAAPPADGTPWRYAPIPETDIGPVGDYTAWEALDAMAVQGLKVSVALLPHLHVCEVL